MLIRGNVIISFEMYDIEVCIPNKVSTAEILKSKIRTLEEGREAEILYDRGLIRINLTALWDLAFGDYATFLDELVGIILHEYLHYFFHINGIPQNEKLIDHLSNELLVLSLGRFIGATNTKDENVKLYEEWLNARFTK